MKEPIISVCIPVYNAGKFIKGTIESVLQQTFSDFELVIIDNCSTDNTIEQIKLCNDKRIRLFHNEENIGAEGNWNRCLDEARGDYIKVLPADDTLHIESLEKQIAILKKNKNISLVCNYRDVIGENNNKIMVRKFPFFKKTVRGKFVIKLNVIFGTNLIGEPGAVMFKKCDALKAGYFDASNPYVIDVDFWVRMLLLGDLYVINKSLSTFRISPNSWTVTIGSKQKDSYFKFIEKLYKDKAFNITYLNTIFGKIMVKFNTMFRIIIVKHSIK